MAAPARIGTGAEPDQPEPYLDEDDEQRQEYEFSGRRVGWFGIVLLLVAVLAVVVAVFALLTPGFRVKIRTKVAYEPAAVFGLQAGECFNGQNGLGVTVLPCSSPHEAEVFATFWLPQARWPGDDAVQAAAQAGCRTRVAGYMNPQLAASAFSREAIYPDQVTWAAGVRTVVCDIRSDIGPITGSVRQDSQILPDRAGRYQAVP
jgi:hypothetical protein